MNASRTDGVVVTGVVAGSSISWDNGDLWNQYTGKLSGIWTGFTSGGAALSDRYFLTHNASQNNVSAWCIIAVSPVGACSSWTGAAGWIAGSALTLFVEDGFWFRGTVDASFSRISMDDGSAWTRRNDSLPPTFTSVHVVFMNHLDVGYNGVPVLGLINNILNIYFGEYFPRAISVANDLRSRGGTERLIWTSQPWLVSLYLDCPPNFVLSGIQLVCPTPDELAAFRAAVARGDIVWNGGIMNMQYESMDAGLVAASLLIAQDLNDEFNQSHGITVRNEDVPNMSRGVIPWFLAGGIQAITVGTNGACYPPQVPKAFVWKDPNSGQEILAMEHPGGYGGITRTDCVETVSGVALCFAFRTDNTGPPEDADEVRLRASRAAPRGGCVRECLLQVIELLDTIRAEYPGASVFGACALGCAGLRGRARAPS